MPVAHHQAKMQSEMHRLHFVIFNPTFVSLIVTLLHQVEGIPSRKSPWVLHMAVAERFLHYLSTLSLLIVLCQKPGEIAIKSHNRQKHLQQFLHSTGGTAIVNHVSSKQASVNLTGLH